ncbi:NIPA-like protein 2 [Strongylocentrotus purpuratus]|uniref:NIPA-like protein 2 n=1 Tax=Strongylocentrotus purpuratus TaxID=7668 RepID=A0A7M7HQE1_STRPU|nr:NIPA-like protein 2 [Strongylocentrotus purpuratus]
MENMAATSIPTTLDYVNLTEPLIAKRTLNHSDLFDPTDGAHLGLSQPVVSMSLLIGASLAVGGNLLISVSMNIQKYSLTKIQRRREAQGEETIDNYDYLKSWLWWSGILLMIIGEGGNFLAYGFGPASVVAPLGTTTVVANAYISRCMGERLRFQDILGTIIIVVGACMILIFSTQNEEQMNSHMILFKLSSWPFLVFFGIEVVLFLVLLFLKLVKGYKHLILLLLPAAILSSLTVLGAKACSSLIKLAVKGQMSEVKSPIFFVMLIVVFVTGAVQIRYVTRAMQEHDASVIVPVYFVFFTIGAILVGVFFYGEFIGLTIIRIFMFIFGCICSFIGVYMITHGRLMSHHDNDDNKDDVQMEARDDTDDSPLLPLPTSLHLVQPPREDGDDSSSMMSSDSGDGRFVEMQDMSATLRDSPKWMQMDSAIIHAQLGNHGDDGLNLRKPHRTQNGETNHNTVDYH